MMFIVAYENVGRIGERAALLRDLRMLAGSYSSLNVTIWEPEGSQASLLSRLKVDGLTSRLQVRY